MKELVIATRASKLALWQAYHIQEEIEKTFADVKVSINEITSKGDKILDRPLALIGGKGHFTKELEDEMLANNADIAVHSLKDVPSFIPEGLELAAITKRQDQSDVFLSHKYTSIEDLPHASVVGTTSLRRRMQLLHKRPDLKVKDLRGNINTRLAKLARGEYDAIILAYIGMERLDLLKDVPYATKLCTDEMIPPMGQAALGIEIVSGDAFTYEVARSLNDEETEACSILERDFVAAIGAGCSAPVAVNAQINGEMMEIKGMIGYPDGTNIIQKQLTAKLSECKELGNQLAHHMIAQGATDILSKAQDLAFKDTRPQRL